MLLPRSWQIGRKAKIATDMLICASSKSPGIPLVVTQRNSTLAVVSSDKASTRRPPRMASHVLARTTKRSTGPDVSSGPAVENIVTGLRYA
jgi:hypothetical protein